MSDGFAPAKVNLFLHVTGRRADGYHLLDSLAVFPAVGDVVAAAPAAGLSLRIEGRFGETLRAEPDNLILRAARLLQPDGGAALTLTKNLPVASGIGGGSADAAATLRLLARLWRVEAPLQPLALHPLALRLGADVPVCLARAPARMGGIGEVLAPAPALPPLGLVLVNPGVPVATAAVFAARPPGFTPPARLPARWPDAAAMARDLAGLTNDLEAPALALQPAIGAALAALRARPGTLLARMSGSGATCYGLFASPRAAEAAAASIREPGWWAWGGGLYEPPPDHL